MKKTVQYISIAALFLIPIFPLIIANSLFFPFITGKAFYFRLLVEIAFASWIILAFLDAKYRPRINPLTIGVTLFTVIALVADLLGMNPLRSIWSNFERMEGWLVIFHLWMFYITATSLFGVDAEGKKWWYRWLNMSFAVAVVVAVYGVFQLLGWATVHQSTTRIDASLGNAAYMAVYMLFHAFIAAYLFFARADTVKSVDFPQWVYAIISVLFGFLVFQTATRGTILGLIGGILLALGLYVVFGRREAKKKRIIAASAIGVIVLIGVVFWFNRDAAFIQNSEVLNRLANISIQDTKTQARGYIWPMAIDGWKERPILGWGQENFNYIFNAKYNPHMWNHEQWFDRAHSVFLDWLTASGLVGFLAYLSLYVLCIMAIWKSSLSIREKSVLTGLVAGYTIHNIFVFDNLASYVFFFGILGFAGSLSGGKSPKWLGTKSFSSDAVEYVVMPIVLVVLVGGLYFLNIRPLQAGNRLLVSLSMCGGGQPDITYFEKTLSINSYLANQEVREQLMNCTNGVLAGQHPGPTKQAFLNLTDQEIKNQIAATPDDARIYTLGGFFYNSIGQYQAGAELLEKAVELSPTKQSTIFQLASAYVNTGKAEEALALMKKAYESSPDNTQAKLAYASTFVIAGKEAEGRKELGDDPALFETQQVAEVYISLNQYPKAVVILKKLAAADPKNVQIRGRLAQVQYLGGMKTQAIETFRALANDFPEYKVQVETIIKQIQEGK